MGGGGADTRIQSGAAAGTTLPAFSLISSLSPAALFIFIYRAPAGVEWEDFAFSASHNGVCVCISEPALSTRVCALF